MNSSKKRWNSPNQLAEGRKLGHSLACPSDLSRPQDSGWMAPKACSTVHVYGCLENSSKLESSGSLGCLPTKAPVESSKPGEHLQILWVKVTESSSRALVTITQGTDCPNGSGEQQSLRKRTCFGTWKSCYRMGSLVHSLGSCLTTTLFSHPIHNPASGLQKSQTAYRFLNTKCYFVALCLSTHPAAFPKPA